MPTQAEADRQKQHFYAMRGFPNEFGRIDGTHVRIQGPHQQEHEFVNFFQQAGVFFSRKVCLLAPLRRCTFCHDAVPGTHERDCRRNERSIV